MRVRVKHNGLEGMVIQWDESLFGIISFYVLIDDHDMPLKFRRDELEVIDDNGEVS